MLQDWKAAVHAAIQAAPWHIDQGEWTSEFFSDGADLRACIDKVTEYRYRNDSDSEPSVEVVYERASEAGSQQAAKEFYVWYTETS